LFQDKRKKTGQPFPFLAPLFPPTVGLFSPPPPIATLSPSTVILGGWSLGYFTSVYVLRRLFKAVLCYRAEVCEGEAIGRMCVCGYVCLGVCVCCVACFKMLKGIQAHTHQLFGEHNAHYYCLSTLFLLWRCGPFSGHGLPLLGGFDSIKVLRGTIVSPTPNHQQSWRTDGLVLCLFFHHKAAWHGRTCQELLYHQNNVVRH